MTYTNNFFGLKLLCIFSSGCIGSAFMYLPVFLRQALRFENGKVGLIMAIICLTSIVGFPYWTSIADKTGAFKKLMMRNMLVALMCTLSIGIIPYFFQAGIVQTTLILFACLGYSFFGYSILGLVDAAILYVLADQKTLFGKQKIGTPIGIGVSSFLTGLLMDKLGSPYAIFIVYTMSNLLFIVAVMFMSLEPYNYKAIDNASSTDYGSDAVSSISIKDRNDKCTHSKVAIEDKDETSALIPEAPKADTSNDEVGKTVWHMLSSPESLQFFIYITLMGCSFSVVLQFLFLFLQYDLNASLALISLLGPLTSFAQFLCFFFSKEMLVYLGAPRMLITAQCAIIVRCLIYLVCPGVRFGAYIATVTQLLHGLGFSLTWTAATFRANDFAPPHLKSSVQGLLHMGFNGIGYASGALFGGLIYEHYNARTMWTANVILAALSIMMYSSSLVRRVVFAPFARLFPQQ